LRRVGNLNALPESLFCVFLRDGSKTSCIETIEKFIIMDDVTLWPDDTQKLGTVALEGPRSGRNCE